MQQSIGTRKNLDERTKIDNFAHGTLVDPPHFGLGANRLNGGNSLFQRRSIGRRNYDGAVVVDIDLAPSLLDQAADHLATRTYDLAYFVRFDVNRFNSRSVSGNLFAGRLDGFFHHGYYEKPRVARLMQRLSQNFAGDSSRFVVHLDRGYSAGSARHLEVHVAEMVLIPKDVGKHCNPFTSLDQSHRDSRHRSLDWNAGIHQRKGPSANGRHRGAAIRFENLRNHSNRVRKIGFVR